MVSGLRVARRSRNDQIPCTGCSRGERRTYGSRTSRSCCSPGEFAASGESPPSRPPERWSRGGSRPECASQYGNDSGTKEFRGSVLSTGEQEPERQSAGGRSLIVSFTPTTKVVDGSLDRARWN